MHITLKCRKCGKIASVLKSEMCIECFERHEKIKKENIMKKGIKKEKGEGKRYKKF